MKLKDIFQGLWQVRRTISSPAIIMHGEAVFMGCQCVEKGSYVLREKVYSYYQQLFFVIDSDSLCVFLSDRRLLHQFTPVRPLVYPIETAHIHTCGDDRYDCSLTLFNINHFQMFYHVSGPSKEYTLSINFTREFENK